MTEFEWKPVACWILRTNDEDRQLTNHRCMNSKACFAKQKINHKYKLPPGACLFCLLVNGQNKSLTNIKYDSGLPLEIVQCRYPK